MSALPQLRERYQGIADEMRKMHAVAEEADRGFTDEETATWNDRKAKLTEVESRIKAAEQLETAGDYSSGELIDETQEERDREKFERAKRSRSVKDLDPRRPLTNYERTWALQCWLMRGRGAYQPTDDGWDVLRRAGIDLRNINLDMQLGERGPSGMAPRNKAECREHEQYRREREKELIERSRKGEHFEQRALSVGTTTAGGFTVPDETMRPLEEAMLQWDSMRSVAETVTTSTGADLPWPTNNDTANKGEIIAENTTTNEQDTTFGQLVLNAYKYSSKFIKLSVELLQDSATNMPSLLGRLLGTRIGRITQDHFTTGTGSGQPNGIVTAAVDSTITTASNTAITYAEMLGLKHSVDPAYRDGARWMFHDTILKYLKEMKDSQNRPLWVPGYTADAPPSFDGDPYTVNQSMATGSAAKAVVYGDLSKYLIRDVRDITLLRLDERFAELHQVCFLAFARYDGDLLDAGTGPVKFMDLAI